MFIAMNRFRNPAGREQDFEGIWSLGSPTLRKFRSSSNSTRCVARKLRGPVRVESELCGRIHQRNRFTQWEIENPPRSVEIHLSEISDYPLLRTTQSDP
jgi:hypothetical protein